ncbi:MAG: hypothetical protein WA940_09215 [Sphingopyxis sp.]
MNRQQLGQLARRAAATQKTFDKFRGASFSWEGASCAHLLRTHLRNMGHRPPKMPKFQSAIGAKRAIAEMGAADLKSLCVVLGLIEIAPAMSLVGDVAILPGDDGPFDAIVVCAGNGKFMGWHGAAEGLQMIDDVLPHVIAAFRA